MLAGVGAGLVVVLLAAVVFLMTQRGPDTEVVPAAAGESTQSGGDEPGKSRQRRSKPKPTSPGDVRDLRAGLFCRNLDARGYSYVAAVDYWRMHGQPNQMDIDRNGIPCETIYPPSDVAAYWDGREPTGADSTAMSPGDVRELPAGLFCRDLDARGYSYVAAVDYWRMHGQPNQMDIDRNGIPCETIYPASDVAAYWYGRELPGITATSGLFCRDLVAHGVSYPEAVGYWWSEGAPDRMDEDLDGIPCETVYSAAEVSAFWYG